MRRLVRPFAWVRYISRSVANVRPSVASWIYLILNNSNFFVVYKGSYLFGNRIVTHKIRTKSTTQQARGSASFEIVGRELVRKVRRPRTDLSTLFDLGQREKVLQNELSNLYRMAQSWNEMKSFAEMRMIYDGITKKERELQQLAEKIKLHQQEEPKTKEPRKICDKHYLNKTKVRDKCTAFFELEQSQKFCAFYSVSFPKGMGEDLIYKCWNAWLTNLRKTYGLTDYIWVAESAKWNATLSHVMQYPNGYQEGQPCNGYLPFPQWCFDYHHRQIQWCGC